jgi:hypothetical protein
LGHHAQFGKVQARPLLRGPSLYLQRAAKCSHVLRRPRARHERQKKDGNAQQKKPSAHRRDSVSS